MLRAHAQAGYALFVVMAVVCIVSVWLANAALTAGYGVLAAANTRDRLNARIAAGERAAATMPDGTGGAVWPAAPVTGFHDYLVANAETGRLEVVDGANLPADGMIILRQWRLSANPDGGRLLEVSTVLVDAATGEAVPAPRGGDFRFSQVVE